MFESKSISNHETDSPEFLSDVLTGLFAHPKHLPSRYLYDQRGSQLFEAICKLDDYYIPRVELEILREALPEVAEKIGPRALVFEPGSGASPKTRLLLAQLQEPAAYFPIDICDAQLKTNAAQLAQEYPNIDIIPLCADFMNDFELPAVHRPIERRLAFFPGSTIGNLMPYQAIHMLRRLSRLIQQNGALLVGVDLRKDSAILKAAYDDRSGVSAAFAMNYLARLNRECHADFHLDRFHYEAIFNPHLGRVEMYLVSLCGQMVDVAGRRVFFRAGEKLRTEVSYKYTLEAFAALSGLAGLVVDRIWTDDQSFFSVQLLTPHGSP